MKLSYKKKFGCTHVKVARVLRVTKDHSISTLGLSQEDDGARFEGRSWVFCEVGDLVMELVEAKKGRVVGYSYLTGPALSVINYEPPKDDWFEVEVEPPKVGRIQLPKRVGNPEDFAKLVFENVFDAKAAFDICVFDTEAGDQEDAGNAVNFISDCWYNAPGEHKHLLGIIHYGKKSGMQVHIQPPEHATKLYANFFQTQLLLNMVKK